MHNGIITIDPQNDWLFGISHRNYHINIFFTQLPLKKRNYNTSVEFREISVNSSELVLGSLGSRRFSSCFGSTYDSTCHVYGFARHTWFDSIEDRMFKSVIILSVSDSINRPKWGLVNENILKLQSSGCVSRNYNARRLTYVFVTCTSLLRENSIYSCLIKVIFFYRVGNIQSYT